MNNMTYEEALLKLKNTVDELEKGSLSLDKSIELFEEGTRLAAFCEKCLNEAEQKITQLKADENDD